MANDWTKITVTVKQSDTDRAASVISMLDNGLMIEDYSDFSLNGMYGELVDESILNADKTISKISIFVPKEKELSSYVDYISRRMSLLSIQYKLELDGLDEEDWAESWKSYFKPIPLGRVTIVPSWESYDAKDGEVILRIDPGMAFGTGTHETTRLCIRLMQDEIRDGAALLDVGCGSGILSICAAKLGASLCRAYDIDPVAVKVTRDNVAADGLEGIIEVGESDLLSSVRPATGGYDICVANIVAEIIVRMLPDLERYLKPHAPVILSGIVKEKAEDVKTCALKLGYRIIKEENENDWIGLMIRK